MATAADIFTNHKLYFLDLDRAGTEAKIAAVHSPVLRPTSDGAKREQGYHVISYYGPTGVLVHTLIRWDAAQNGIVGENGVKIANNLDQLIATAKSNYPQAYYTMGQAGGRKGRKQSRRKQSRKGRKQTKRRRQSRRKQSRRN